MPTYDYECSACEHTFEAFQQITAKPLKSCPNCGKRNVQRLIGTGAAIIFKGSGFYQTDYNRSKEYKSKMDSENKKASGDDTKNDTGAKKTKSKNEESKKVKTETKSKETD